MNTVLNDVKFLFYFSASTEQISFILFQAWSQIEEHMSPVYSNESRHHSSGNLFTFWRI